MTETMKFGLDLGMGALKLHGNQHSIQLISQVAVNNGPLVGRMLGLGSSRLLCALCSHLEAPFLLTAALMTTAGRSRT